MALQFIFGPSGAGKSQYIYNKIIQDSLDNPRVNYILLVPEQYSMALQRKMVRLHPNGGTMNIDVIGFNRLAYRVFDELNVKPARVLEDFGKSMLIRQVAGSVKEQLTVYGGCLDKPGFIDEVKSLMSEMYQYDISRDKLKQVIATLEETGENGLLLRKLRDMLTIFEAFDRKTTDSYIVAEQLTELLASYVGESALIKNSVIVMDGFTGFTPIQLALIRRLMVCARDIKIVLTIDARSHRKKRIAEHELFYLTRKTQDTLIHVADMLRVPLEEDVFIGESGTTRWSGETDVEHPLCHMEQNLFRYPYERYERDCGDAVRIVEYDTPRREIMGIAGDIRRLVMHEGYRYRDIAVISGNLEGSMEYVEQQFPLHDIPYFLDYSQPVKNNPYVDAIGHALMLVENNFSYDSVFAFLKSGVVEDLGQDEIEALENYCLARGVRGVTWWNKSFDESVEDTRMYVMDILLPFYERISGTHVQIKTYIAAIRDLMDKLHYELRMAEPKGLYGKLCEVLDKMSEIMSEDEVEIGEFHELIDLGLKDLSLGRIPNMLDMVIVGDITRTRLDEVKVLYVVGVNDGIIPKKGTPAQIISDREKEKLVELDMELAPTEKMNSYVEQFYLYMNMTKPKDMLCLSYTKLNCNNEPMRPSYIIGRVRNIFPSIRILQEDEMLEIDTPAAGVEPLVYGIRALMDGETEDMEEILQLYRLYMEHGETLVLSRIQEAVCYHNIPEKLSETVADLVHLKLMSQSVSRLEHFSSCAYAYFLQYTIGLRERDVKKIDNRNIGNILHSAMEKLYRHVHDNRENDWSCISDAERDEMVAGFVEQAFETEYREQVSDDGRYKYLRDTLVRIGKRTAEMLCHIGEKDNLKPEYFEYRFTEQIPYGEDGKNMTLQGIVDRADLCYDEVSKQVSMRVIDYKSGRHDFKISELYEGLQLQLAIYTNIMLELVDKQYNKGIQPQDENYVGIAPEGMYYYQMKDPYVDAESIDEAEEKREKELKLRGLVNDTETDFDMVLKFAVKKACNIAERIAAGEIEKNPIVKEGRATCEYCAYVDVCRFDDRYGGNRYRYPKYKESDKKHVYEEIRRMMGGEPHGVDAGTTEGD